ncbi:MAG: Tlg2-vesicle protein [Claussenomyces sp. TS43310]|nr:MAG: Tlg2-vesicle protein [Claussenomyces sp. TS43310]
MSADYSSTAKALTLPISPVDSPSRDDPDAGRPPFSRIASQRSRRRDAAASDPHGEGSYRQRVVRAAQVVHERMLATYKAMSLLQLIAAGVGVTVVVVLGVLVLIFSHRFFAWLEPLAHRWRDLPFGWAILWALIFVTAFPPMIGYSSLVTTAGFVFGFWQGWLIVATSATFGSLASFIACRTILSNYVHRLVGEDKRFKALALTLKHDGIKILILVRLCPLPYSLSNGALSTIPTITALNFALGTALSTPKLMIHAFIGSRLALLAESGGKMDTLTRLVNYASIAGGVILGITLGYVIYNKTTARARELELEEEALLREEEGRTLADPDDFENGDTAVTMLDDDISLWDTEHEAYRDDFTDDGASLPEELDETTAPGSKKDGIS